MADVKGNSLSLVGVAQPPITATPRVSAAMGERRREEWITGAYDHGRGTGESSVESQTGDVTGVTGEPNAV